MNLINFKGMQCYYNSIVTIAAALGIDYTRAFGGLWSEIDYRYDPYRKWFVSKYLLKNLAEIGCSVSDLPSMTPEKTRASLDSLSDGDLLAVGMDAYYVPWNPYFGLFFGPHYFVVEYDGDDVLVCHDPTYGYEGERLTRGHIIRHACHMISVRTCARGDARHDDMTEMRAAAEVIPKQKLRLLSWLEPAEGRRARANTAYKYVECMINNRYLYHRYLEYCSPETLPKLSIFDDGFFENWIAVKNGMLKASIMKGSVRLLGEIHKYLDTVIERELTAIEEGVSALGEIHCAPLLRSIAIPIPTSPRNPPLPSPGAIDIAIDPRH
ncbi:MAG: hypothetical protein LBB86_06040 [Oscillospiraceae bacterium]|jgi:hypothetical protein|nr:hypothetical protein [Oscillospiraceae bacterium]